MQHVTYINDYIEIKRFEEDGRKDFVRVVVISELRVADVVEFGLFDSHMPAFIAKKFGAKYPNFAIQTEIPLIRFKSMTSKLNKVFNILREEVRAEMEK